MCLCARQALAQATDSPCSIPKYPEHCPSPITPRPHTGLLVPCLLAQGSALLPAASPREAQRTSASGPFTFPGSSCTSHAALLLDPQGLCTCLPPVLPSIPLSRPSSALSWSLLEVPLGVGLEEKQEVAMQLSRKLGYTWGPAIHSMRLGYR